MDRFTGARTPALVTAGLTGFFRTIAIGLMFPTTARSMATGWTEL